MLTFAGIGWYVAYIRSLVTGKFAKRATGCWVNRVAQLRVLLWRTSIDKVAYPCHLIPVMRRPVGPRWQCADVYEMASDFYLSDFIDIHMFCMIWYYYQRSHVSWH